MVERPVMQAEVREGEEVMKVPGPEGEQQMAPEAGVATVAPEVSEGTDVASQPFEYSEEAPEITEKAAPSEEGRMSITQEQQLVAEAPLGPFNGLVLAIPYIAAAIVGSAVFVLARKRTGL
jgi:hypothetical protein